MANYYDIFKRYLDDHRIIYTEIDKNILMIEYQGTEKKKIPLICNMDERTPLQCFLMSVEIAHCTEEEAALALAMCNVLNKCAPGARFYLDDDYEVCAVKLLKLHPEYLCGDIIEAMNEMAEAVDAAYMNFRDEMGK